MLRISKAHSNPQPRSFDRAPTPAAAPLDSFIIATTPRIAFPDLAVHNPTTLDALGVTVKNINGKPHLQYNYSIANRGPGHLVAGATGVRGHPAPLPCRRVAGGVSITRTYGTGVRDGR